LTERWADYLYKDVNPGRESFAGRRLANRLRPGAVMGNAGEGVTTKPRRLLTSALRIPVKWGTDSGACGAASERSDAGYGHDLKVPHISQDFLRF
jgi:hypothetical protein